MDIGIWVVGISMFGTVVVFLCSLFEWHLESRRFGRTPAAGAIVMPTTALAGSEDWTTLDYYRLYRRSLLKTLCDVREDSAVPAPAAPEPKPVPASLGGWTAIDYYRFYRRSFLKSLDEVRENFTIPSHAARNGS